MVDQTAIPDLGGFDGQKVWTDRDGVVWRLRRPAGTVWKHHQLRALFLDHTVPVVLHDVRGLSDETRMVAGAERNSLWTRLEKSIFRDPDQPVPAANYDFFIVDEYRERRGKRAFLFVEESCS